MNLSKKLIKDFAKEIVNTASESTSTPTQLVGTVVTSGGSLYVQLDGSTSLTPVTNTASYEATNRVLVTIEDHTATITGNFTTPANDYDYISGIVEEEAPEGSYEIAEWAISTDSETAPTTGWSTTMELPDSSDEYLWQRIVRISGDTKTVVTQPQKATTMNGLYVFMNQAKNGTASVIDGGSIIAGTLVQIGYSDGYNTKITENGVTINDDDNELINFETYSSGDGAEIKHDNSDSKISMYSSDILEQDRFTLLSGWELSTEGDPNYAGLYLIRDWNEITDSYISLATTGNISLSCVNLRINSNTLSDFVIEEGTDSDTGFSYRKWESGKKECWAVKSLSFTCTSRESYVYYGTRSQIVFPSNFFTSSTIPMIQLTNLGPLGGWVGNNSTAASNSGTGAIRLYRLSSASATNTNISVYAIGT